MKKFIHCNPASGYRSNLPQKNPRKIKPKKGKASERTCCTADVPDGLRSDEARQCHKGPPSVNSDARIGAQHNRRDATPHRLTGHGGRSYPESMDTRKAKYAIGDVVKHRVYPFRGVIFDVDPTFSNTEEWYNSIPAEVRPSRDQPFYHLFAENSESEYIAYVSEQNLLPDTSLEPVRHPQINEVFEIDPEGRYKAKARNLN